MKILMHRIPFNLKVPFFYWLLSLATFTLYRITFLLVYSYRLDNASFGEILKAMLTGLRFDIVSTAYFFGPFLILASIHPLNRFRLYIGFWIYSSTFLFLYMVSILVSDIIYFENANKHIGYEAFVFLGKDMFVIIESGLKQNFFGVAGGLLALVLIIIATNRIFARYPYIHTSRHWKKTAQHITLALVIVVTAMRGGLQESPIRASNSIISKNSMVNALAVNGVFTVLMDMKVSKVPKEHALNPVISAQVVRDEIGYPGARFVDNRYPLLRKLEGRKSTERPPNIVLVMLENWTGRFISPITDGRVDGREVTPHFNRLLKKGLFFNRFFATGGRTTNGMMSILSGIPDRPGLTAVRTPQVMGNFSGLGSIMKSAGYQTMFVTGGDLHFDNKHTLMPHWGFETVLGKSYMDSTGKYKIGAWGYDDADTFDVLHRKILERDKSKPFLAVTLTLSTHYPYKAPDKKFELFGKETRDYEFLNVYHYADWAVNEFMKKAAEAEYFDNTIFFFVADHTHHRYLDYYEDRSIPFLVYAPGRIVSGIRNDIGSQLDVIPTIIGTTGKEVYFSAMGRDLLKKEGTSAYFAYGSLFGWIQDKIFYYESIDGEGYGQTATLIPPHKIMDFNKANRALYNGHYLKSRAFLNLSYDLMNNNLVFPAPEELEKIRQTNR